MTRDFDALAGNYQTFRPAYPSSAIDTTISFIARGSAMECAAILDVARLLDEAPTATLTDGKALLVRIVEMLSRMSR